MKRLHKHLETSYQHGSAFLRTPTTAKGFIFLLLLGLSFAVQATETAQVRVQLKWFHQFQFAGFYAALEKGFFAEAGLEVELLEGGPRKNPTRIVADGGAEFGVGSSTLIIDHSKGLPVVAVAAIFQHSPFVLIARREQGLETVRDLEGLTLMVEEHAEELLAYLKLAGVDPGKVHRVPHTGTALSLAATSPNRVDAATAYLSTEPYEAMTANIPHRIFYPRDSGIDFYGDTLFTSRHYAEHHPHRVAAMRDALARGWRYALKNQDEIIDLILHKYSPKLGRLGMGFEAQAIQTLLLSDVVDIGYMSASRWQHIADVFAETGLLSTPVSLDGFLFEQQDELPSWVYPSLAWLGLIAVITSLFSHRLYMSNTANNREIQKRVILEEELQLLVITDSLTGLYNRTKLNNELQNELKRARRYGHVFSVILVDIDHFKRVNDSHGHQAGDEVLVNFAQLMRGPLRDTDIAGRWGGEEFMIICVETGLPEALAVAEKLRRSIETQAMSRTGPLTASFGVAVFQPDDDASTITKRADDALYRAKSAGRNRVELAAAGLN